MEFNHEFSYGVYLREDRSPRSTPQTREKLLKSCGSYAEARRIQRWYRQADRSCVIRFEGIAGGGD